MGQMTSRDRKSDPAKWAVALASHIEKFECATITSPCSLKLDPKAGIHSYRKLCALLTREWVNANRLSTMVKFMFGDAMNQGEEIYGEEYACVLGTEVKLAYPTVLNITWIARRITPERRRLNLSFRLHQEVAPLAPDEQEFYLSMAEEEQKKDPTRMFSTIKARINDDKCRTAIANVPKGEQGQWLDVYEQFSPSWTKLVAMIAGEIPLPEPPTPLAEWVSKKTEWIKAEVEGGRGDEEVMAEAMLDLVEALSEKQVLLPKREKTNFWGGHKASHIVEDGMSITPA